MKKPILFLILFLAGVLVYPQANNENPVRNNASHKHLIGVDTVPSVQASNLIFTNIMGSQATISWTNGNGSKRVVFIREDTIGYIHPNDSVLYSANSCFGMGDQIGDWFCIYDGTGSSFGATCLQNLCYKVMVCEYNDNPDINYNTSVSAGNPSVFCPPAGLHEINGVEAFLKCSPNPSNGRITIEIPNEFGKIKTLEIFDCIGKRQLLQTDNFTGTNISDLPCGLYFLVLTNTASEILTSKIIKE